MSLVHRASKDHIKTINENDSGAVIPIVLQRRTQNKWTEDYSP